MTWRFVAGIIGAAVGSVALVSAGWWAGEQGQLDSTVPDAVAAGFAYDMATHHMQAVELAELVTERTRDPEIRVLARDVALTQQAQIGQMRGWLDAWGLPPTSTAPAMEWMAMDGPMPGLATEDELASLRAAEGVDADRLFLELLIEHHQGGLHMAEVASASTSIPYVADAATSMALAQRSEIEALQQKLDELGPT